ncbi:uncharacterized protein LOC132627085 isoform X1 [Lycium barbarum]|uniref:uncharacterized protein LOC132627085 isoform X1 n=1 Tax=Lycium barbarum TaxID=112863 RepID=UPI00293EBFD5|nr:uncharacterized protein LOC132627085 isoform X1 [Lycium barbarum]XP_060198165.1 uncharacterized protein LOC132627085 isoform X1 [Lycium barbarum]XP_060198166.1 uncharacterized protein LOC132627085 isoform X1 [Lycium barbarum]
MEDRNREDRPGRDRDRRPPKRARSAGYSGDSRGGQPQQQSSGRYFPPSGRGTQSAGRRFDSAGPSGAGQSSRASGSQTARGSSQSRPPRPRSYCGKSHPGECYRATRACFSCGRQGHVMCDCPMASGSGSAVQPTGSAAGKSSTPSAMRPAGRGMPAQAGRGRGRGSGSGSSGPSIRIYALASRQDQEASPNVVTGTLLVFSRSVYALIDPGSTLSYIAPLVANEIGIESESIEPFEVATPVGGSVIARQVYRDCSVIIYDRCTKADLVELDMLEFDVIMGMDWFASCYANVDCQKKVVRFQFPGEPVIEWFGCTTLPRGKFISYLKAKKMIQKGYIYHLVRVHDTTAETPSRDTYSAVSSGCQ